MKNHRLIYSSFSSRITDLNYIIRGSWIGFFGFFLIIFNAFEAESGFSGELSVEGYIIFVTLGVFFFLNYLSQSFKLMKTLLALVSIISLAMNCLLAFMAIGNIHYHFASIFLLIVYSFGTFSITFFHHILSSHFAKM